MALNSLFYADVPLNNYSLTSVKRIKTRLSWQQRFCPPFAWYRSRNILWELL